MTGTTLWSGERDPPSGPSMQASGPLVERIAVLVVHARSLVATQANVALTMLPWEIGRLIDVEVLT